MSHVTASPCSLAPASLSVTQEEPGNEEVCHMLQLVLVPWLLLAFQSLKRSLGMRRYVTCYS